jgi:polysaccharide export outer membrane protein
MQHEMEQVSNTYTNTIKPGDVLSIVVSSSKQDLASPYNLFSARQSMMAVSAQGPTTTSGYNTQTRMEMEGYTVSLDGYITFPVLGQMQIAGLTRAQLSENLRATLVEFMPDPIVTVTFINFKITVLGEVKRPGSFNVNLDRVSILDALALAGDMTVYGERKEILIIRENNGVRETERLNIQSRSIFESPFFYLQQNDTVVVDPIDAKARSISPFVQNLPLVVSLGSLATAIATLVIANR